MNVVRYADRPDLRERRDLAGQTFPVYHERVGGEILRAAPESMTIEAPVTDWEEWTGMRFPEDGEYVFPGALAPLVVLGGVGRHVEPNVWVRHTV